MCGIYIFFIILGITALYFGINLIEPINDNKERMEDRQESFLLTDSEARTLHLVLRLCHSALSNATPTFRYNQYYIRTIVQVDETRISLNLTCCGLCVMISEILKLLSEKNKEVIFSSLNVTRITKYLRHQRYNASDIHVEKLKSQVPFYWFDTFSETYNDSKYLYERGKRQRLKFLEDVIEKLERLYAI